jgi:arylsulfate sulfotransferase
VKTHSTILAAALLLATFSPRARGTQADDTTITITGQTKGATPFISQVALQASDTSVLKSVQFTIAPKAGSVTRPLSGTYSNSYLSDRGDLEPATGLIFLPVYGLYSDFSNVVTLTYHFNDGSSKQASTTIVTAAFIHPCGLDSPTVLQARTGDTTLSYDYMLVKEACSSSEPAVVDTDGALRWVSPAGFSITPSGLFDNAIYQADGASLYRVDLDGTITFLRDYSDIGATDLHHNIDPGKFGMILDLDTAEFVETINIEVDLAGNVLKTWDLAQIIRDAMTAGGDDPNQFVFPSPADWFHNNSVTYNRADDSVIISSREDFVICLDYGTSAIKWILGDTTKKWYQFPSLAKFALTVTGDGVPPIGQHSLSITYDQGLLLFDNGTPSGVEMPPGVLRAYASPRKYQLDLAAMTATEVWNYERDQSILSPYCGSIYEDAPLNYVIDYAVVGGLDADPAHAQLLGLNAAGETVFNYEYVTDFCNTAYNTTPLHLESTAFPAIGPQALNLSTRGLVGLGDNVLIGGFIVTGDASKEAVLRVLGPSLAASGVTAPVTDPVLTVYDSSGQQIAANDDWQDDPAAAAISAEGLAPSDSRESATRLSLAPGSYTVVVTGKDETPGVGLVEAYDVSAGSGSQLANLSTRGVVGTDEDLLISGLIIGEVANTTVVVRAIGPSLASAGVTGALADPLLTIYDGNGLTIASNDDWQSGEHSADIEQNGLAPSDDAEAALILHLPAGAYTTIVQGADGGTGVGLVEVYNLQ